MFGSRAALAVSLPVILRATWTAHWRSAAPDAGVRFTYRSGRHRQRRIVVCLRCCIEYSFDFIQRQCAQPGWKLEALLLPKSVSVVSRHIAWRQAIFFAKKKTRSVSKTESTTECMQ